MVETYVGEGCALTRFWRERLLGEREVIIASPYLTSPLAEEILDMCDRQTVSVLTRCDLLDFLRGASSVAVLRRLIEVNVAVFVTPKLHAKVICTTGWASIGSKNLTLRSESNLEASVVVESPRDVARVRRVLEEWRSSGEQVMLADLEDIETQCDLLRADWAGLRARLRQTRDALGELRSNRQIQRRIEEERERQAREVERDAAEAARRLQDRVREAEERIEQSRYVSELRGIEVRDVPRGDGRRVRCIRRRGQDNLLVWLDGSAKLADKHHYVVFTQGRVAWLKLNKKE